MKGRGCESTCSSGIHLRDDFLFPLEPSAELRGPAFQALLARVEVVRDSGIFTDDRSSFMDDRSMCTFATDQEVSEFVCVHFFLNIQGYPSISKDKTLVLYIYYSYVFSLVYTSCWLLFASVGLSIGCGSISNKSSQVGYIV